MSSDRPTVARTAVAMGTAITIRLVTDNRTAGEAAIADALDWFTAVERCCSRFEAMSELTQLSQTAGRPVAVSAMLFEALAFAMAVAEATDGAFDPVVGHHLTARGFNRHHQSGEAAPVATAGGSFRDIRLNAATQEVTLARSLALDLGAVAKGLAVDCAARALAPFTDYMIDAGGDLYAAGRAPHGGAWRVAIPDPATRGQAIAVLTLTDGAACTSGCYERGRHLVDARTGDDATGLASVTVLAPSAMVADALATAAFVLGPVAGGSLLHRERVEAVLVDTGGGVRATPGVSLATPAHA